MRMKNGYLRANFGISAHLRGCALRSVRGCRFDCAWLVTSSACWAAGSLFLRGIGAGCVVGLLIGLQVDGAAGLLLGFGCGLLGDRGADRFACPGTFLAAEDHALAGMQAAFDLSEFRSFDADLHRADMDVVGVVERVDHIPASLDDQRFDGNGDDIFHVRQAQAWCWRTCRVRWTGPCCRRRLRFPWCGFQSSRRG